MSGGWWQCLAAFGRGCDCVMVPLCASASLQAWLEVAWQDGFDTVGCQSLGGRVQVGVVVFRDCPVIHLLYTGL